MKKPLVSIIVSIYNVSPYLPNCLKSLQEQDYSNLELLLIDDGSTDDSGLISDHYATQNSQIQVFHKSNGGLSDARNYGLQKANGEYVIFFDGDDYAAANFVSSLVTVAQQYNHDITCCGYYVEELDAAETLIERVEVPFIQGHYDQSHFSEIPINNGIIGTLSYAWNKLYRRQFLLQNQLLFQAGLSLIEDIQFNARALVVAKSLGFISDCLVFYCHRPRKTLSSASFYEQPFEMRHQALLIIEAMLQKWGTPKAVVNQLIGIIYVNNLKAHIINLNESTSSRTIKSQQLKAIISRQNSQQLIKLYQPQGLKERLVKLLLQWKQSLWLLQLEQLRRS